MVTEVVLPMLGITVEKGKILKWFKLEGDRVEKGESIFEVEADKVTTDVESPASGILKKILIPENVEIPLLTVVAVITAAGEDLPEKYLTRGPTIIEPYKEVSLEAKVFPSSSGALGPMALDVLGKIRAAPAARKLASENGIDLTLISGSGPEGTIVKRDVENHMTLLGVKTTLPKGQIRATPIARRLAEEEGILLGGVEGTGPHGRVMKMDVAKTAETRKTFIQDGPVAETLFGKTIPMNRMRSIIAKKMSESAFTAPHIHFFNEVGMGNLIKLRNEILPDFEKEFGVRISVNDFVIKAVGLTIREFPMLNASVERDSIRINPDINVGLAVAMKEGLIVPAIPRADRCGLGEIAKMRADLIERARNGKLTVQEIERGTFTVSSLAHFDVTFFTAILNPPQSGILTVGKLDEKLYIVSGEVKVKQVTQFGLSVDHRIIDGAVAGEFLTSLKKKLENPFYSFLQL